MTKSSLGPLAKLGGRVTVVLATDCWVSGEEGVGKEQEKNLELKVWEKPIYRRVRQVVHPPATAQSVVYSILAQYERSHGQFNLAGREISKGGMKGGRLWGRVKGMCSRLWRVLV